MALFGIADLHLSLGSDKPMDVFPGWGNYVEKLKANWCKLIRPEDTVVIAGDISWAMKLTECYQDFSFLNSLPGRKILIKGNHDYWWTTKKKMDHYLSENHFDTIWILFNNAYMTDEFSISGSRGWLRDSQEDADVKILNREVRRLQASLAQAKATGLETVVFLHYPPIYGDSKCNAIINVLKENNIKRCYYGHIHGGKMLKYAFNGIDESIHYKLISGDCINFIPLIIIK